MKRRRYPTEQIVAAIKQHELGAPAVVIIRKLGIAERTFRRSNALLYRRRVELGQDHHFIKM